MPWRKGRMLLLLLSMPRRPPDTKTSVGKESSAPKNRPEPSWNSHWIQTSTVSSHFWTFWTSHSTFTTSSQRVPSINWTHTLITNLKTRYHSTPWLALALVRVTQGDRISTAKSYLPILRRSWFLKWLELVGRMSSMVGLWRPCLRGRTLWGTTSILSLRLKGNFHRSKRQGSTG